MKIVHDIASLRSALQPHRGESIGFVPTMGCLHDGHLRLVATARAADATVVASIFVNPTQFGPGEDHAAYPRDLDSDGALLASARTDFLFAPSAEAMYPLPQTTWVDVPDLAGVLEGASRPGHFRGVATVVAKLLNIVQPQRAYFGEKDYQQVLVIERMVADLAILTEIVRVPTVRDVDGVALSSRNRYLTAEERRAARVLPAALQRARQWLTAGLDPATTEARLREFIAREPLAHPEQVAVRDARTLGPLASRHALVLLFVRFGRACLLDQAAIELPAQALKRGAGAA